MIDELDIVGVKEKRGNFKLCSDVVDEDAFVLGEVVCEGVEGPENNFSFSGDVR